MSSYVQRQPPAAQLGRRLSGPAQSVHHPPIPRFRSTTQPPASPSSPHAGTQLVSKPAGCGHPVGKAATGLGERQGSASVKLGLRCDVTAPNSTCTGGGGDGGGGGGGDGGGGGGHSRRRRHGSGAPGGGDGSGGGGQQDPPRQPPMSLGHGVVHKLLVAAAAMTVGVSLASPPPALAADSPTGDAKAPAETDGASNGARAASIASALGAAAVLATADGSGGGDMVRVKRLLREVFGELTELRARLDGMDAAAASAASAAEDALVVPLEGLAVRPYSRALAAGMRLRSRAQVSGWVDAPALLPLLATEQHHHHQHHHHHAATSSDHQEPQQQQQQQHPDAGGDAPFCTSSSSTSASWGDMMREALGNLAGGPRLRLRVQSLWGAGGSYADAAAATASPSSSSSPSAVPAAPPQWRGARRQGQGQGQGPQEESRPVAAHLQLATAQDGRSVLLDKLLLKAEAHPRLRLMLASHGALENIGMNVNPFAGAGELQRGLSTAARMGHDLELLSQGGAGAAAAAKAGNLAAAVGAFTTGGFVGSRGADELPTADSQAAATASAAGVGTNTMCAQFSVCRFQRFVLTAAWAASSPSCPAASSYPSPSFPSRSSAPSSPPSAAAVAAAAAAVPKEPGPVMVREGLGGRGAAAGAPASAAASCSGGVDGDVAGSCRHVQRGLIGAVQLGERLSAAVWIGDALSTTLGCRGGGCGGAGRGDGAGSETDSGCGPLGPWAEAQPVGADRPRRRQHRVGLRLARLPDEDTGRSYVLSVSHRRTAAGGDGATAGRGNGARLLVAEASAALPLANGVVVTPGVVLVRRSDAHTVRTLLSAAAQTTWMF